MRWDNYTANGYRSSTLLRKPLITAVVFSPLLRGTKQCALLDLTPIGGQAGVSEMNADERGPQDAGSNSELAAGIQPRSRPPCSVLAKQENCPDSQRAWRL